MYKYLLTQNKTSPSCLPIIPHRTAGVQLKKKSLLWESWEGRKLVCEAYERGGKNVFFFSIKNVRVSFTSPQAAYIILSMQLAFLNGRSLVGTWYRPPRCCRGLCRIATASDWFCRAGTFFLRHPLPRRWFRRVASLPLNGVRDDSW